MSKVAVASTDGISVNEHFGRSKEFLIYEVEESGAYTLLERRENNTQRLLEASEHTAGVTAQLLADVEAVLVTQIGLRAEQELRNYGVIALPVTGPIDKALKAYGKRGKFVRNTVRRLGTDCRSSRSDGSCGCSHGCK